MNNESHVFLKTLEEIHDKKFKNNEGYLESCKTNKDLNPKDYKIDSSHKLDEYFNKYGKKLKKGQLLAYKKDELWLMNKNTKYWKIENDSDFIYFEAQKNLKPLWISLIAVLAAGAIAGGVTTGIFYFKNRLINAGGGGEGGGGEEIEPDEPTPIKVDLTGLTVSYGNVPRGTPDLYNSGIKFNNDSVISGDKQYWYKENVYSNAILNIGFIALWGNYTWGNNLTINAVLKGFETKSGNVDASFNASISTEDSSYGADISYAYTIPFSLDLSKISGLKEYLKITQIKIDFVS